MTPTERALETALQRLEEAVTTLQLRVAQLEGWAQDQSDSEEPQPGEES